jgi:hypothetical protein
MALNDESGKHKGSSRNSHTDENCVIVESLIWEDRRKKARETHCKNQLWNNSALGMEHYHEGMFKLVKQDGINV